MASDDADKGSARSRSYVLWVLFPALALAGCGKTAEEYFRAARATQFLEEKERLYSRALDKAPDFREARMDRAWVYAMQKKPEQALADYDVLHQQALAHYDALEKGATKSNRARAAVARRRGQDLAFIFHRRGQALERSERLDEAVRSYSIALRENPGSLNPYADRAGAYFKMGRYAHSMQDYTTLLDRDIDRKGEAAEERRGEWRLLRGFAAVCAGQWESAAGDFQVAIKMLRSPARRTQAILSLYFVACRIGNRKDADAVLRAEASAARLRYQSSGRRTPWVFTALWYVSGLIDEEQLLEASGHRDKRVEAERLAGAHYYVGARHLADGATDEALRAFKRSVAHRDLSSVDFHMAKVELERLVVGGKTAAEYVTLARKAPTREKKIELYTRALGVDPGDTDARLNRAMLYSLGGLYDQAIDDYTQLLKLYKRPSNVAAALRCRGWTYAQKRDHRAAIKDYEAAIGKDPALWQAREGLAVSLCSLRRYKEAAAVYALLKKQRTRQGLKSFWQLERAFALCCAGEWQGAAEDFRAALKGAAESPVARTNLYVVECRLGDKTAAANSLREFARSVKEAGWANSVARYAAQLLDEKMFLKLSEHSDKNVQLLRIVRANYYIGAVNLIRGNKAKAREAFEKCVRLGHKGKSETWEYRMALAELARAKQWR